MRTIVGLSLVIIAVCSFVIISAYAADDTCGMAMPMGPTGSCGCGCGKMVAMHMKMGREMTRALTDGSVMMRVFPCGKLMLAVKGKSHQPNPNASISAVLMTDSGKRDPNFRRMAPGVFMAKPDLSGAREMSVIVNTGGMSQAVTFRCPMHGKAGEMMGMGMMRGMGMGKMQGCGMMGGQGMPSCPANMRGTGGGCPMMGHPKALMGAGCPMMSQPEAMTGASCPVMGDR